MIKLVARTAENGSRTLVHAAVGEDGEDWKGQYLSNCEPDQYPFSFCSRADGTLG